jgi:hypothetical protein
MLSIFMTNLSHLKFFNINLVFSLCTVPLTSEFRLYWEIKMTEKQKQMKHIPNLELDTFVNVLYTTPDQSLWIVERYDFWNIHF